MYHLRRMPVLLGIVVILFCGCSNLDTPREMREDLSSARPQVAPAPRSPMPVEAPPPPKPRSELDRIPKIEPTTLLSGDGAGVSYFSAAALPKIIAFYKREMKQLGWKGTDTLTDNVNYANLNFTKDKALLIVSLGLESGSTPPRVFVSLTSHGSMKVRDLPRYPGTKTLAEFDHTAIYMTADSVSKVHHRTRELLKKAGWRERRAAVGDADNVDAELEKGEMLLSVYIAVAPAQGNQTTIQYSLRKKDK
jgi:hypothetical protein